MLESKFIKFLMSILKRQVNSSSMFLLFFSVITYNSFVIFELMRFLLWTKGSYQSPNFYTSKCFGENLPNSSSYFPNNNISVLWRITSQYFFRSNVIYFPWKRPINSEYSVLSSKFIKFLLILKQQIGFSSNFATLFSVMRHNFSALF